jgi:hypothetical protein
MAMVSRNLRHSRISEATHRVLLRHVAADLVTVRFAFNQSVSLVGDLRMDVTAPRRKG